MPFDYARNAGSVVIQGLFCLLSGIRRRIVRKMRACMVDGRWSVVGMVGLVLWEVIRNTKPTRTS